jgi:hypothetical protein
VLLEFRQNDFELFGPALSLLSELAFSLQFAKMSIEQLSGLQKYNIPDHIQALDARLQEGLSEDELADLEYQFKVVYRSIAHRKVARTFNSFTLLPPRVRRSATSW